MVNNVFFFTSLNHSRGAQYIDQAMLEDRALVSGSQPGGREIKLKYNIIYSLIL